MGDWDKGENRTGRAESWPGVGEELAEDTAHGDVQSRGGLVPPITSTVQTRQRCDVGHVCLLSVQPLRRPSSAQGPCRASHRAGEAHPQQVLLVELPPVAHPEPISESTGMETLTTQHPLGLTVGTPREKALGPALRTCVNQVQLVEWDGMAGRAAYRVTPQRHWVHPEGLQRP